MKIKQLICRYDERPRLKASSRHTQIEYTLRGVTEYKSTTRSGLREPVIDELAKQGYEILDRRLFKRSLQKAPTKASKKKSRSDRSKHPSARITVQIPARRSQIIIAMLRHTNGGITWHFCEKPRGKQETLKISIPIPFPPTPPEEGRRRSSVGTYLLVILATAFVSSLARKGLAELARKWEKKYVDYAIYRIDKTGVNKKAPLRSLPHHEGKRGLLLIHGTFSTVQSGFSHLLKGTGKIFFRELLQTYSGRIVGFDHLTVSASPDENAAWLIEHLERGEVCRYDIITHSRGGLVARSLVESIKRKASRSRADGRLVIDRVLLVAVPNKGTPLVPSSKGSSTDPYVHFAKWLGNFTSILPGTILPYATSFLAEILKYLGAGLKGTLPGLAVLSPGSSFLEELNNPSSLGGALYYSIIGNFEAPKKFLLKLADAGLDKLFHNEDNDFAVSISSARGADEGIPDERCAVFSPFAPKSPLRANVNHFAYFKTRKCLKKIAEFIGLPIKGGRKPAARRSAAVERVKYLEELPILLPPPMKKETPDFSVPLPLIDISVIGDGDSQKEYKEWLRKWKRIIAEKDAIPPEPFPMLMAFSGLSRVARVFKTRGEDTYWHSLIGTERSMRRYLEDAGPELSLDWLQRAGAMLFRTIFPGETETLLNRTLSESYENTPSLVMFTTTSPWIADFPWEMIFDPARRRFLSLGDVCFFRGVISTEAAISLPALPLVIRMLIAVAQPRDQMALNVREEIDGLKHALLPLTEAKRLYIDVLEHTSMNALKARLKRTRYHILHYIGHGDYDEISDRGKLILETPRSGLSSPLDADGLCELLLSTSPQLRLILLNGCETAEGGRADFNRGTAPALVAAGIPCVVGNRLIVGDKAAITFATTFYQELSRRKSLAEAIMTARRTLASSPNFEPYEWAVPNIFAIDPEARFF